MAANDSHSTGMRGGWKDTMWSTYAIYVGGIGRVLTINGERRLWVGQRSISGRSALNCALSQKKAGGDPRRRWMKRNVDLGLG